MAKKRQPTEAELANDPSLKWNSYKYGEALECDLLTERVRFWEYTGEGRIKLKTLVLAQMAGDYDPLIVRRPKSEPMKMTEEDRQAMAAAAHAYYGSRNKGK